MPEYTYIISKNQVVRRKKNPKEDDNQDDEIPHLSISDILFGRGAKKLRKEAARRKELARKAKQAAQPKPEKTATKEVVVAAKPATAPAAPHKEAEKPQFFTAEHDAAILRMKGEENKSWKEIAAALGFAPGQVKGRFRELAPRVAEEVQAPAIAAWAKGVAKAAPAKVAYHRQPEPSEKPRRFVARPKPDEMFDRDELHLIARIIRKDEKLRWERVSHRFFDKTGRRLHELEFKDRFDPDSDDETV